MLFNGEAVKSCTMLAQQAEGQEITTIEGLGKKGKLHPMQEAFQEHHALQCGFCTPGMVMMGLTSSAATPTPTSRPSAPSLKAIYAAAPAII